jgi:hypothetical protein
VKIDHHILQYLIDNIQSWYDNMFCYFDTFFSLVISCNDILLQTQNNVNLRKKIFLLWNESQSPHFATFILQPPQVRPHRKFVHHFCLHFVRMRKSSDVIWQRPGLLFLVQDNVNWHNQNMRFKQVKYYQK